MELNTNVLDNVFTATDTKFIKAINKQFKYIRNFTNLYNAIRKKPNITGAICNILTQKISDNVDITFYDEYNILYKNLHGSDLRDLTKAEIVYLITNYLFFQNAPRCNSCHKNLCNFESFSKGFRKSCGVKCPAKGKVSFDIVIPPDTISVEEISTPSSDISSFNKDLVNRLEREYIYEDIYDDSDKLDTWVFNNPKKNQSNKSNPFGPTLSQPMSSRDRKPSCLEQDLEKCLQYYFCLSTGYYNNNSTNLDVLMNYRDEVLTPKGKELDFYIKNKKVAIECGGSKWHTYSPLFDKENHLFKMIHCHFRQIRLFTFDSSEFTFDNNGKKKIPDISSSDINAPKKSAKILLNMLSRHLKIKIPDYLTQKEKDILFVNYDNNNYNEMHHHYTLYGSFNYSKASGIINYKDLNVDTEYMFKPRLDIKKYPVITLRVNGKLIAGVQVDINDKNQAITILRYFTNSNTIFINQKFNPIIKLADYIRSITGYSRVLFRLDWNYQSPFDEEFRYSFSFPLDMFNESQIRPEIEIFHPEKYKYGANLGFEIDENDHNKVTIWPNGYHNPSETHSFSELYKSFKYYVVYNSGVSYFKVNSDLYFA